MNVTIETLAEIRDEAGDLVYGPDDGLLLLRVCMSDGALAEDIDAWWSEIKPSVATAISAYLAHPVPAGPMSEQPPTTVCTVVPIPVGLLSDTAYPLAAEVLKNLEEAVLMQIGHQRGDHRRCTPGFVCDIATAERRARRQLAAQEA